MNEGGRNDALDWALRVADPAFTDWDGFTAWLDADPARAERYDATVLALATAEQQVAAVPPTPVVAEPAPGR
ncbi:MAG: iron dicitrate transport regulator FecR, partial [Comamonadaceae bacterium]